MIRINEIKLSLDEDESLLKKKASKILKINEKYITKYTIFKKSIDARKKDDVHFTYSLDVTITLDEEQIANKCKSNKVQIVKPYVYELPENKRVSKFRPVVIGFGPAGMFAGLILALSGLKPIILERGKDIDARKVDVQKFWSEKKLNEESNVQFGEGGAGTFSDGKLTTGTHDPRISAVIDALVESGAPEDVKWSHKPHIGTDILRQVVKRIRQELISLGCDVRFGHCLSGLETGSGALSGVWVACEAGRYRLDCDALVLAPGHSARDTFAMLHKRGVPMEAKPFAVGVRIEQRQSDCDTAQYKQYAGHPGLPASTYKLSCHLPNVRGVFSFCVCPGGQVVAAASEPGRVVTNGMSHYARSGKNINGGLLVGVTPEDFGTDHPLAGVAWQRQLEAAAFRLGGGGFLAPCQRVEDFLAHRPSTGPGAVLPSYRPGVTWCDLHDCLPSFLTEAMEEALPLLERKLRGYAQPDALLTAMETRSSSPVRILRDESGQSALRGLYPCGEGACYAGCIRAAAADGMRCAEKIWEVYS